MKIYEIVVSELAKEDLRNIYNYVRDVSFDYNARLVVERIAEKIASFDIFPERTESIGKDKRGHDIRATSNGKYRIIYVVDRENGKVTVARIFSVGQDFSRLI